MNPYTTEEIDEIVKSYTKQKKYNYYTYSRLYNLIYVCLIFTEEYVILKVMDEINYSCFRLDIVDNYIDNFLPKLIPIKKIKKIYFKKQIISSKLVINYEDEDYEFYSFLKNKINKITSLIHLE